jgi:hypothetical protein
MSVSKRVRYYFVARGFALMSVSKRVRYYFVARGFALMLVPSVFDTILLPGALH